MKKIDLKKIIVYLLIIMCFCLLKKNYIYGVSNGTVSFVRFILAYWGENQLVNLIWFLPIMFEIYVLSKKYVFSYAELRNAVIQTFENRKTPMTMDSAAFSDEFLNDPVHQTRWKSFLKKKKALIQVSMSDAMDWIKAFVRPLFEGTEKTRWNPEKGNWE